MSEGKYYRAYEGLVIYGIFEYNIVIIRFFENYLSIEIESDQRKMKKIKDLVKVKCYEIDYYHFEFYRDKIISKL